jgi:hypothetical protein
VSTLVIILLSKNYFFKKNKVIKLNEVHDLGCKFDGLSCKTRFLHVFKVVLGSIKSTRSYQNIFHVG